MTISSQPDHCQSCGSVRTGKFCSNCGEKKLSPDDFKLKKFILQAVDIFTHFEGKFFKTFKYLLFYPGKLTKDYIEGRRVSLMKPLQLYLIVGIAFFFLFKDWDIFYNRLRFVVYENFNTDTQTGVLYDAEKFKGLQKNLRLVAETRAEKKHLSLEQFIGAVDARLPDLSKLLIIVMIPTLSLFVYLVGFRRQKLYVPHLVHATHLFTFSLALLTIWLGLYGLVVKAMHVRMNFDIAFIPVNIIFLIYIFFSMRKVMVTKNVLVLILQTLLVAFGYIVSIFLYRMFIVWFATFTA